MAIYRRNLNQKQIYIWNRFSHRLINRKMKIKPKRYYLFPLAGKTRKIWQWQLLARTEIELPTEPGNTNWNITWNGFWPNLVKEKTIHKQDPAILPRKFLISGSHWSHGTEWFVGLCSQLCTGEAPIHSGDMGHHGFILYGDPEWRRLWGTFTALLLEIVR